ncbi:MAG: hypothetical protein KDB79_03845 [Acidobacteria bacterium]|nr:hypothetical protein [Acidobacteriota bacterium]
MEHFLDKPQNFNFKNTIYSHGWCELAPFSLNEEKSELSYVFSGGGASKPRFGVISDHEDRVKIRIEGRKLDEDKAAGIISQARHLLRFDEDLNEFYEIANKNPEFTWIGSSGTGRLLRSGTVFEDLIKTLCTTNCSWALTKNMVNNLVGKLGVEASGGKRAFPTPEAMAGVDEDFYRNEIRAGYRSPYFLEIARQIAGGEVDPEKWLGSELPTEELKKEMKKLKGIGDYAAENLLKLVGRYDGLALDSYLRSEFRKKRNNNKACTDKKIISFYKKFGKWRGLAIWFDMGRDWF